jgi:hypothetical protein
MATREEILLSMRKKVMATPTTWRLWLSGLRPQAMAPGYADLIRFDKRQTGGWCDHLAGKTGPASCRPAASSR